MSKPKTIWLREETYNRLDSCRGKRETFSECVERLIDTWAMVNDIKTTLGSGHQVMERPNK